MSIPSGPDDLTWAWFEDVTGWSVDDVRVEQIGIGIGVSGALYRVHLGGSGCPSTVVVKLPAVDPVARGTAVALGLYRREVAFFAELGDECPVTTPACFHHDIDEAGDDFVVVMEDCGEARLIDQVAGVDLADAERIVDRLADWQAAWWNDTGRLVERGIAVPLGSPMYPAVLPTLFAEGWARLTEEMPHVIDGLGEIADRYATKLAPALQTLDQAPMTLLHGDYRADNMLFATDDDLVLLDFQLLGSGAPAYDLAYFVHAEPRRRAGELARTQPVRSMADPAAGARARCRSLGGVGSIPPGISVLHHDPRERSSRDGSRRRPSACAHRGDDGSDEPSVS